MVRKKATFPFSNFLFFLFQVKVKLVVGADQEIRSGHILPKQTSTVFASCSLSMAPRQSPSFLSVFLFLVLFFFSIWFFSPFCFLDSPTHFGVCLCVCVCDKESIETAHALSSLPYSVKRRGDMVTMVAKTRCIPFSLPPSFAPCLLSASDPDDFRSLSFVYTRFPRR